jgi:hypothetical protein
MHFFVEHQYKVRAYTHTVHVHDMYYFNSQVTDKMTFLHNSIVHVGETNLFMYQNNMCITYIIFFLYCIRVQQNYSSCGFTGTLSRYYR